MTHRSYGCVPKYYQINLSVISSAESCLECSLACSLDCSLECCISGWSCICSCLPLQRRHYLGFIFQATTHSAPFAPEGFTPLYGSSQMTQYNPPSGFIQSIFATTVNITHYQLLTKPIRFQYWSLWKSIYCFQCFIWQNNVNNNIL